MPSEATIRVATTMKFYLLKNPKKPAKFAAMAAVGTWSESNFCEVCRVSGQHLVAPLQLYWEPGSTEIADFSWNLGGYTFVVKERIREHAEASRWPSRFSPAVVLNAPDRAKMRHVPFPYTGPSLYWCETLASVPLDVAASGLKSLADCPACGRLTYEFKRNGLVARRQDWGERPIFHVKEFGTSAATFVSESECEKLIDAGFSNLDCVEAGVVAGD